MSGDSLFNKKLGNTPLALRMRPKSFSDFFGQEHLLGVGKSLREIIEKDNFSSIIIYGPPGVGKTSLAEIIARVTKTKFINLSAVLNTVSDIRKNLEIADNYEKMHGIVSTFFIDEIHRFNKAQQDVLLPHIESGRIRFVGATTLNPQFYINSPLNSRSQIFKLEELSDEAILKIIDNAVSSKQGLDGKFKVTDGAKRAIVKFSSGDARKVLNVLEMSSFFDKGKITESTISKVTVQKNLNYDRNDAEHFNTISAFIKSMRGSDPDASIYWLAKMLHAGEDIRFIIRRIVIFASEDVGLADSNALRVAVSAQQAIETIGMPEARITLAHATLYMATAPKSNSAYLAIESALREIKKEKVQAVPIHLQTKAQKKFIEKNSKDYKYPHDFEDGFISQQYLSSDKIFYNANDRGMEKRIKERMDYFKNKHRVDDSLK